MVRVCEGMVGKRVVLDLASASAGVRGVRAEVRPFVPSPIFLFDSLMELMNKLSNLDPLSQIRSVRSVHPPDRSGFFINLCAVMLKLCGPFMDPSNANFWKR
jgi:hypothetical protein